MYEYEYQNLSNHLREIAGNIPIRWGRIQNDDTDSKINMFEHHNYNSLNNALMGLRNDTKDYFKKRWFLWKCSQCDEYLFYRHNDIIPNPNHRDQDWDFEFFGRSDLRFDLKGSVIPREIKGKMSGIYPDPIEVIKFNYDQQSRGVRNNYQNRLFVIHMPYQWQRENHLRANFNVKKKIYDLYINRLRNNTMMNFYEYSNCKSDIIFLRENSPGEITEKFASDNIN